MIKVLGMEWTRSLGLSFACLLATMLPGFAQEASPDSERVAEWIELLGSDDFVEREEATTSLIEVVREVREMLEETLARNGLDPEVAGRIRRIMAELERPGEYLGRMHGIPVAVKDQVWTQASAPPTALASWQISSPRKTPLWSRT